MYLLFLYHINRPYAKAEVARVQVGNVLPGGFVVAAGTVRNILIDIRTPNACLAALVDGLAALADIASSGDEENGAVHAREHSAADVALFHPPVIRLHEQLI